MEFMGFFCAKFGKRFLVWLVVAAWSTPALPQARPLDLSAARQSEQQQGQEPPAGEPSQSPSDTAATPSQAATPPTGAQPLRLTFQQALELARKNSTQFQAVVTNAGVVREDRTQARNALLPSVVYDNSAIYTQRAHATAVALTCAPPVVFIADNEVHEYLSQGNVHQVFDVSASGTWRRASSAAAVARAQVEIAARGLVVTVAQNYFKVGAAQRKLETATTGADEGDRFFKLTQDLEHGGEVAHSDVIKAELQMQERRRQLLEAQLGFLNSRLDLAVLIFPDFNDNYEVADDLHSAVPLPALAEVQQQAARDNPDLRAALAAVREAGSGVTGARAGYLPSLALDYWYGIDAPRFAANSVINGQKFSNFGSSASATLSIPIWNWGATQSRIKQAELRRSQAQRELSLAQRKLLAEIRSLYAEAETALNELGGLSRSAELAAESLRLTTLRYKDGEATG